VQLPPSLKFDIEKATHFFEVLKKEYAEYSFALEVRHNSWLEKEAIQLIRHYNITLVISQSGVGFPYTEEITADNIYVRFHGPGKLYASLYSKEDMKVFAAKIKKWAKTGHGIWVFFNNDYYGYGLENANMLQEYLAVKTK